MGKGTIISNDSNGLYHIQVNYDRSSYDFLITTLTEKRSKIFQDILDLGWDGDEKEKQVLELQLLDVNKQINFLRNNFPSDEVITAFCADLTDNLTGEVGTIEVPGEVGNVNIQPGYKNNSIYNKSRDGQRVPSVVQTPEQLFYNLAILPGWQKWKPTFRYATITYIDGDKATIEFGDDRSSQLRLKINQVKVMEDVDIEYMNCNGSAFSEGDEVLVKFENQNASNPKIIGFKENPKGCGFYVYIEESDYCTVFDTSLGDVAQDITYNDDNLVLSWPVLKSDISNWLHSRTSSGYELFQQHQTEVIQPSDAEFIAQYPTSLPVPGPDVYNWNVNIEGTSYGSTSEPEEYISSLYFDWHGSYELHKIQNYGNPYYETAIYDSNLVKTYTYPLMNTNAAPPYGNYTVKLETKNLVNPEYSYLLKVNDEVWTEDIYINEMTLNYTASKTRDISSKVVSPLGELCDINYTSLDTYVRGYVAEARTLKTELIPVNGKYGMYTENVIFQFYYSSALLEHEDFTNCYYTPPWGSGGWHCTFYWPNPYIDPPSYLTYEVPTEGEFRVHASIGQYEDTSVINPFTEERNASVEQAIVDLVDTSIEAQGGIDVNSGEIYQPTFVVRIYK